MEYSYCMYYCIIINICIIYVYCMYIYVIHSWSHFLVSCLIAREHWYKEYATNEWMNEWINDMHSGFSEMHATLFPPLKIKSCWHFWPLAYPWPLADTRPVGLGCMCFHGTRQILFEKSPKWVHSPIYLRFRGKDVRGPKKSWHQHGRGFRFNF